MHNQGSVFISYGRINSTISGLKHCRNRSFHLTIKGMKKIGFAHRGMVYVKVAFIAES